MPDIGYSPAIQHENALRRDIITRRTVLGGALVAGATLAALVTPAAEAARAAQGAGPELTRLLRAMAGLKMIFAAGLFAAAYWRLAARLQPGGSQAMPRQLPPWRADPC